MDQRKGIAKSLLHIGERIKRIRESKGMTQKELAGDTMSRNMLSMIESGKALPSIDTLVYLSDALSVPVGYFFAGDDELVLYSRQGAIESVHRSLEIGDIENIIGVSSRYSSSDSEMRYYLCLAYLKMAETNLNVNNLVTASAYLKETSNAARNLPYGGDVLISVCDYVSALIESVPLNNIPDQLINSEKVSDIPIPAYFVSYLVAYNAVNTGNVDIASAIARSGLLHSFHSLHIRGAVNMRSENYENAANLLDLALSSEGGGFFSRYKLLCDLEICRKNLGDFEMAYSLSTSRMEMLGMFSK